MRFVLVEVLALTRFHEDAHEVRNRAGVGLVHDRGAVGFDRLDGDLEVVGDLFVQATVGDAFEHFLFAGRELVEERLIELAAFRLDVTGPGHFEHAFDQRLEGVLVIGLFDEVDGPRLEGLHRLRHVAVAGDEDDGNVGLALQEMFLHFQPAHAGHADVENEHRNGVGVVLGDEALAAVVEFHVIVACFEQPLEGVPDGVVVVHDVDGTGTLTVTVEIVVMVHLVIDKVGISKSGNFTPEEALCHPRARGKWEKERNLAS